MINRLKLFQEFFRVNKDTIKLSNEDLFSWVELATNFEINHTIKYDFVRTLKMFLNQDLNGLYSINWKKANEFLKGVKK